ncbi:MAG: type II toxin-antitoxin system RelE/ParE family toxin [Magnetococcales bacterium]|nr:type II toxin-antitoxin system RelE/ParE family toxin [Magnetococcales bacterium]
MSDYFKPLVWIGNSKECLRDFPEPIQQTVGYALFRAQEGKKHPDAKPLKGFMGAGVLEIVDDHDGDTYRAVYTVRLEGVVYVLHAFQKKSKRGIATPKQEIDLVKSRLQLAQQIHEKRNAP